MRDRHTKIILCILLLLIMNIAIVGYLYSKESLSAIDEYKVIIKL